MFKNMRIKTSIILFTSLCLFALATIITTFSANSMINEAIKIAKENISNLAKSEAGNIKAEIELSLDAARTLADILSTQITDNKKLTRDKVNSMLISVLKNNEKFLGTYTLWEPNAFDGKDNEFIDTEGHDGTGRFIPYWTRTADGGIAVDPLADYTIKGAGDYYQLPKETKKECILEPYTYPVQGKEILLTSLVVPIIVEGKFYGIAGIDISLDFLQNITDNIDIYEKTGINYSIY